MAAVDAVQGLKNYEILKTIGRGGMGEVFLARDLRLQRLVAIKYLRSDFCDVHWPGQLGLEAQLLPRLKHPNIVQIYHILDCDGSPALVMEYVDGRNLHVQQRERRSDLGELLRWLSEIAAGLAAAHAAGIVHNDLKAENVLIGSDNIARVTDFGIASVDLDLRGDIAALGALARKLLHDHPDISPGLEFLLQQLTDKNPSRRPTGQEAAQRLREAWLESTQDETALPVLESPEPVRRAHYGLPLGVIVAALAAGLAFYVFSQKSVQRDYVAVLPTTISGGSLTEQQQLNIRSTVQQALQQGVMATRTLALVNSREVSEASGKPAEIARVLGADELIASSLDCSQSSCELTIDRLGGAQLTVIVQRSTSIFLDSTLESYSIVQRQWHWLYPDSTEAADARELISDEAFLEYLSLYQSSYTGGVQAETFARLEALLGRANRFLPLYDLYTQSALEMHDQSGDARYLDKLQTVLTQAEFWAGKSLVLGKCRFNLALAKKDYAAAGREIEAIGELGGDEVLINKMLGDLYSEQSNYELAERHYGLVLELKPSRAAYYSVADNFYDSGRPGRAMEILEKSLRLYPDDIDVLGLMGMIALERGDLDEAIVRFEQSQAIQPHAIYYNDLGLAYLLSGDYSLARDVFKRNIERGNRRPIYLLNLADSEALVGNDETADRLYRDLIALAAAQESAVELWILSQAYAQLGLFERAISLLKRIENEGVERSDAAFNAALVYTLAGQNIAALVEVDRALGANFGAIWFALPWFDRLCNEPKFPGLISQAGFPDRCADTVIL